MSRIRNIKPDFFDDEGLATVSPWARLCFIGLWTEADREGRLEDRPGRLKARLFPFDAKVDVKALIDELVEEGCVVRYSVNGSKLLFIPRFAKHQYLSRREPASSLPGIDQTQTGPVLVLDQSYTTPTDMDQDMDLDVGRRTEDNVPAADAAVPSRFEEFWDAYPKKRDKGHAEKAFKALRVSDGLLSIMLSALEHQCRMTDWTKDGGKFIPLPATWLHGHRWDDEIGTGTDPERDRKLGPSYTPGDWWLSCQHQPKCETGPMHRQREAIDSLKGQP